MQPANPAPTAEGSFTKTPFAHLLVYALDRKLDGTFEITGAGGATATLVVAGGLPARVRTTLDPTSEEDVEAAAGFASTVERLFGLPADATFAFFDGVDRLAGDPGAASAEGPFDPFPLLWRGIRQAPSWEHVDVALRRVGPHGVRLAAAAEVERFGFARAEASAVEMLRGQPRRVTELAASKLVGPTVAQLLVYCLLITRQVDLVELPRSSLANMAAVRPSKDGMPAVRPSKEMPAVAAPAATPPPAASVPASAASAPAPAPSSASAIPVVPPSTPTIPQSSPGSAVARVQLQRQVQRAPIAVEESVAVSRVRDGRIASPIPKALSIPPLVSAPPPARVPEAPQIVMPQAEVPIELASKLSPEHEALRAKILERAEKISSLDYFEMLGVPKEATPPEVQKAFIALAKTWHPDRLPESIADVKDACSKVFAHITEANATLSDPKRREHYLSLVKDGGATPDEQAQVMAIVEASTEFQKAEVYFKRNDNAKAYEHVRRAFSLDPLQSEYLALLTWLEALRPDEQTKEKTLARIRTLDGCIEKNPKSERAYFYRGQLYKRIEDTTSAVRDFKKAAELNPRNLDAAREVRLHTMRSEKAAAATQPKDTLKTPKEDVKNLLGKLFKK